jgi:hypothetical protein
VTHINNPYDGWEALKMMFEARNPTKKSYLLNILKMEEGSQMIEFLKFIKKLKA